MQFASTPLSFAVRGGAALFCMSTFETRPFEEYDAVISAEIPVTRAGVRLAGDRSPAKAIDAMAMAVLKCRDRLEADLQEHPGQYLLWGRQARGMTGRTAKPATAESPSPSGQPHLG